MKKLNPTDMMSDKRNKNADQAIKDAITLLWNNDFATKAEADRIMARIERWEKDFYREFN